MSIYESFSSNGTPKEINTPSELKKELLQDGNGTAAMVFFHPNCSHCHELKERLLGSNSLAKQYGDKCKWLFLDITKHQELAEMNNITAVPSTVIVVVKDSVVVKNSPMVLGGDEKDIKKQIDDMIAST